MADPDLTPLARITPAHFGSVSSLTAVPLPDGTTLLASAGDDNRIRVWDPTTGASVNGLAVEDKSSMAAIRLPDATLLVIGADDGTIKLLDARSGVRTDRITAHEGSVTALLPFPLRDRPALFASAGLDRTVRLWDPATSDAVNNLVGHTAPVVALAALPWPDGRTLLASGSDDGTVRLWDPVTGHPIDHPIDYDEGPIKALASLPLPDGRTVLAVAMNSRGLLMVVSIRSTVW